MAVVATTNTNASPHVRQWKASNRVYIGDNNTLGDSFLTITLPMPTPIPITYKANVNQILGFVPLNFCNDPECRTYPESEYQNLVVGSLVDADPFYNDKSTFLISNQYYYLLNQTTAMYLQERTAGVWANIATLTDNTYGTYIPYSPASLHNAGLLGSGQAAYCGYIIDWRKVLLAHGEGVYRFAITIARVLTPLCGWSEPFCLQAYDCNIVLNTVKFEATIKNGFIGDCNNPAKLINLCGMTYTDQIRFEGFFGFEKAEYVRKNIEYNNGIIYNLRNEEIKKFELKTGKLPKWLHDRFKAYGLMADKLLVSDYNENNPDYNIKRKGVVCDSGYEPVYVQNLRKQRVTVTFVENQQNLIRRRCCNDRTPIQ